MIGQGMFMLLGLAFVALVAFGLGALIYDGIKEKDPFRLFMGGVTAWGLVAGVLYALGI